MADVERFIGRSKAMVEVYKAIGRVAAQNVTVLIRGESGCGKELVARAIMQNSHRADQPYVAVNCAAIPDQLLESELFGHEKGAFTGAEKRRIGRFEQCDGGTIFLDEIGDMSQVTQGKVLRLLQEQKFERVGGNEIIQTNVRIIAATNRPLEEMVEEGTFREDLLYRLNGFTVFLPPLRERVEDIPLLLEYFFRRAKHDMSRPELEGISPEAFELLQHYEWPGNVRQLQSVVRQSVLNTTGTVIASVNLPDFVREGRRPTKSVPHVEKVEVDRSKDVEPIDAPNEFLERESTESAHVGSGSIERRPTESHYEDEAYGAEYSDRDSNKEFPLFEYVASRMHEGTVNLYAEALEQMERRLFTQVLEATGGNQSKAAEILGITRGKVRDRIATFGIQVEKTVSISKRS